MSPVDSTSPDLTQSEATPPDSPRLDSTSRQRWGWLPRSIRTHLFLSAFVALALIGGGLRFIPTSAAALAGSGSAGQAAGASTACAAK